MLIKTQEHFLFDVFDVGELAPLGDVVVVPCAFKVVNKFLHQSEVMDNRMEGPIADRFHPKDSEGTAELFPHIVGDTSPTQLVESCHGHSPAD